MSATRDKKAKQGEGGDGEIERIPSFIPPGRYQLALVNWWTGVMFGRQQKLALNFVVADFGDHYLKPLSRWYNARLKGPGGTNGKFSVGWNSDLLKEYSQILDLPTRVDRIALSRYKNLVLVGEVATVTHDRSQAQRHSALQYSVIRKLLGVAAGTADR